MARDIQDHYFREAKREGFRSRAAYKLMEIDERRRVLRRGDRVLDCGCAPGSWLQVAAKRVGRSGIVVGIDRRAVEPLPNEPNVHVMRGDLRETPAETLLAELGGSRGKAGTSGPSGASAAATARFTVVLSDMAPDTTGDRTIDHHGSVRLCDAVLDLCPHVLAKGGTLVMKVLEGEAYPELLRRTGGMFDTVKGFRPAASRKESTEMYVVGKGFRGERE